MVSPLSLKITNLLINYSIMAHILDLTPETRAIIFEHCLVVGKIFPHLKRSVYREKNLVHEAFSYETPNIALLSVCRRFNQEATPILYQQNTLTFGSTARSWAFFTKNLKNTSRASYPRSIEIHLLSFELSFSDRKTIRDEEENPPKPDVVVAVADRRHHHAPDETTTAAAAYAINSSTEHTRLSYAIHEAEIFALLKRACILHYRHLSRLTIRLKNPACQAPCCCCSSSSGSAPPLPMRPAPFHPNVPQTLHLHPPPPATPSRVLLSPPTESLALEPTGLRRRFVQFWIAEEKAGRAAAGESPARVPGAGQSPARATDTTKQATGAEARRGRGLGRGRGYESAQMLAARTRKGMDGRWRNLG